MNPLDLLDQIVGVLEGAWWAYPLIALIVAGDAVIPVLPGETAVITGGVLTIGAGLSVGGVMLAGGVGALVGDSLAYLLGRTAGPWTRRTILAGERSVQLLHWAQRQLAERGATVIVMARFIPGGRTATAFTAGATDYGYRRFAPAALAGAVLWSVSNVLIGRVGGRAFEDSTWRSLALALGIAVVVGALIEGGRALLKRRSPGPEAAEDVAGELAGASRP